MLLFVAACFILLYWPVLFSFLPLKTGISIQLVAIENLNVTPATLLDFSVTTQNEIAFPIRVGRFVFYDGGLMKGQYRPSST